MNDASLINIQRITRRATTWGMFVHLQPSEERYQIGVMFTYSATSNQLRLLIESLDAFDHVECVAVVSEQDLINHQSWFSTNCNSLRSFVFKNEACAELAQFDALILPESNVSIYHFIPPNIIRIGLPHGTDVAIYSTLFTYGGGFCFDYILSATEQPTLHESVYRNTFPKLLRTQQSSSVTVVPFGSPKLDEFINEVFSIDDSKKTAIIYHLSLLSIEEPWVESQMLHVLKRLLEAFPSRSIVYRVHHLDRQNPTVQRCVKMGRCYKNFHFSMDDSYVKDYAKGALMVLHREYESHLFDLATGAPTLLVTVHTTTELTYEHSERYFTSSLSDFCETAERVLSIPFDRSRECIESRCCKLGIYNPGNAVASLVENIPTLIQGKANDDWIQYDFDNCSNTDIDSKLSQLVLSKRTFGHYAFAFASFTQNSPISLLLLAEHFVRHQSMKDYFYPYSLQYFCILAQHKAYSSISKLAELWWVCKGKDVLEYCLSLVKSGHIVATREITWLKTQYELQIITQSEANLMHHHFAVINVRTRERLPQDEVLVVGISSLTEKIIEKYGENVVAIFSDAVSNTELSGSDRNQAEYMGKPVFCLTELTKFHQNIVVASHNGLVTMVNKITLDIGITNEIYGVVDDLLLDEIISSIPMFSDYDKTIMQEPE